MAADKSASAVKPSTTTARPGGNGAFPKMQKYLNEVLTELKKTTWPTKSELVAQTQVVIGLLVIVAVFISGWDYILGQIFKGISAVLGVRQH